jgi:HD superfamily phosphohydrolase
LAFLLYPTTTHTRFDHTLGVVAIVDRLIDNLNRKPSSDTGFGTNVIISDEERFTLRLAALLHDIGHGPFSHVSEEVYGRMPEFLKIKKWINEEYKVTPKPHEILAFLIVSSTNFNSWFDEYIRKLIPESYSEAINLSKIAEYIIGYSRDPQKKYLADIINGPMDADKLDYLARDAKFSGLRIGYDVDRYFKTIYIHKRTIDGNVFLRLGVPLAGVNSLEQMIISKMTLYSSIYHHQKVRCAERMFELLCDYTSNGRMKGEQLKLKHPINFLEYTDSDFLSSSSVCFPKEAIKLHRCLNQRLIMKRALIISQLFVENFELPKVKAGFTRLLNACRYNNVELKIRLVEETNKIIKTENKSVPKIYLEDIIIDIPKQPSMEESISTTVPIESNVEDSEEVELDDIIPIKRWAEGYNSVKWRGHIFCYYGSQEYVNKAARKLFLKNPYNIEFKKPATTQCKIQYSILDEENKEK